MKKYFILLIILAFGGLITSCGQEKDKSKKEVEVALDKIDSLKGIFNPSATINPASSHWAVRATFDGQQYQVDTSFTAIRAGKIPYLSEEKTTLPFAVKYFDANGKLLGQYSIENPTSLRSCEPGKEAVKPGLISSFEILLPAIDAIQNVHIVTNGKEAKRFVLPLNKKVDTDTNRVNPDSVKLN
ncbi:MAG TPA: hypothetical protein PKV73_15790 [Agriterribacter sp.]|nr:hypothetical protein [Chitinophagaceae bacterium]HRP33360.1 hypothetical protein [Agriterribacter sp.]